MKRYLFVCLGIVVFALSTAQDAAACECIQGRPGPCTALTQTGAVFVGRVVGIIRSGESNTFFTGLTVHFAIEQSFKGLSVTQKTVEVKTGANGGDCGYDFKQGQRYLVFATRSSGALHTSICSNTQPASEAEDDIELLNALVSGRPETRLFGRIELLEEKTEASPADMKSLPLAGIRVEARSGGTVLAGTTDTEGRYRINNVPPGRYLIRLLGPFPPNLDVKQEVAQSLEVRLPSSCGASVNFPASAYGVVRGRILDSLGRPGGKNIDVALVDRDRSQASGTRTGSDGTYEFRRVRAGRYVVGVGLLNPPSAESPYPRTYASSASGRQTIVEIVRGVTRNVDIRLPRRLDTIAIVGHVVDAQGAPVKGASLEIIDVEYAGRVPGVDTETAADGSFSVIVLRNRRYEVRAYIGKDFMATGPRPAAPTITTNGALPPLRVVLSKVRR
jgi:hypothetical protein